MLIRTGLAVSLVLASACEEEQGAPERISHVVELSESTPEDCRDYASDSTVFEYCLYSIARSYVDAEEADLQCSQAGEWDAECRHNWVSARMKLESGFSTEELVEACDGNDDCTFELLDFRPDPDLETQLKLCFKYAGRFRGDCGGHSVQRWWLTEPDEEEWMRVASLQTPFPEKVGYWLGVAVACEGIGNCAGAHSSVQETCQRHVDTVGRRPDRCPSREKKRMPGSNRETPSDEQATTTGPQSPDGSPLPDPTTHGHVPGGMAGGEGNPAPDQ
jgi:hypothetical protein